MIPLIRPLSFALICTLGVTATVSADDVEDAVEYRQSVMNVFYWNTHLLGAMTKGKVPFDKAAFKRHADDLAAAANMDILSGFPEDSVSDDSDAKDEIWLDWGDFESKLEAIRSQSAKLADVAGNGNEAAMKAQFEETRRACKGCHDSYKN